MKDDADSTRQVTDALATARTEVGLSTLSRTEVRLNALAETIYRLDGRLIERERESMDLDGGEEATVRTLQARAEIDHALRAYFLESQVARSARGLTKHVAPTTPEHEALVDTHALIGVAKAAGLTLGQAERVIDALAALSGSVIDRLLARARAQRVTAANRAARRRNH